MMNAMQFVIMALAGVGTGETVLLDFQATWCAPCRQMAPVVEGLAAKGHSVRTVDVDREPKLARRFNVASLPCFVMLVNGREVDRVVGATTRERLESMLSKATGHALGSELPRSWAVIRGQSPDASTNVISLPVRQASAPLNLYSSDNRGPRPNAFLKDKGNKSGDGIRSDLRNSRPKTKGRSSSLEQRLLAATARLRVNDPVGQSIGAGTIIDAGEGEALILTCAHIFADSQGKGEISVDLFCQGSPRGLPGKLIGYNMDLDVALVAIRPGVMVTPAPVAAAGYRPRRGEKILSVGCDWGADPTVWRSYLPATDKVYEQPTVIVAGQPVVGRSGGGLFNAQGMVIGVCYAADPQDNEGLYASLTSIWGELDRHGLSFVYHRSDGDGSIESRFVSTRPPELPKPLLSEKDPVSASTSRTTARALVSPKAAPAALTPAQYAALSNDERAALWALHSDFGNLTCIVRAPGKTGSTRAIVLKNVSAEFLQHLVERSQSKHAQHLTSRHIAPSKQPAPAPFGQSRKPWAEGTSYGACEISPHHGPFQWRIPQR